MGRSILLVGLGGFIGSVARYMIAVAFSGASSSFPLATLVVNVAGSFVIGLVMGLAEAGEVLTPEWRFFLATGFCGGFTTFSTFSYESIQLMNDGELLFLGANVVLSVVLSLAAAYLGMVLIRSL